jgi:hypothetical protein
MNLRTITKAMKNSALKIIRKTIRISLLQLYFKDLQRRKSMSKRERKKSLAWAAKAKTLLRFLLSTAREKIFPLMNGLKEKMQRRE